MKTIQNLESFYKIIDSEHHDPFEILGMHQVDINKKKALVVRAFLPEAQNVVVVDRKAPTKTYEMEKIHDDGFFEVIIPKRRSFFEYNLKVTYDLENTVEIVDPYSFLPVLSEFDLYLFNEGTHLKAYDKLGAHYCTINGIEGTHFAVWAPCAKRVSVKGHFNNWDGRRHQMRVLGSSGVWEIFIPDVRPGEVYKYEVKAQEGWILDKADPYGFYSEYRPSTGSIVYDLNNYTWQDTEWLQTREQQNALEKPLSIYEVHLGSWMRIPEEGDRYITYREAADKLVNYVKEMGYTHIELLPIAEHPFDGSWGYQVTGYFAPTSRFGTPDEFRYFVDQCHQNDIGVIVDWVPAHFPRDPHGLARFDGTACYEHADPKQGEHPDWGTLIYNFGRSEVKSFLISNALFWFEQYHIDGLRVDAVASMLYLDYGKSEGQWVPNCFGGRENLEAVDFMKQLNSAVYQSNPGALMIAEESTAWPGVSKPVYVGGLGYGFKWNMGWMNDFLRYISKETVHRKYHHNDLTFGLMYAFTENFILVLSHDEVVHGKGSMMGKMKGDYWQQFANLRAAYGFMYGHPGKKLLFMGGEFGQWNEWNHDKSLDWNLLDFEAHKKLQTFVKDLNNLYKSEPALWEVDYHHTGFDWIDFSDSESSLVSFVRNGKDYKDCLIFVCNFTPVPREGYRLGVPHGGLYKEVLNSDSEVYGGSNIGNAGEVWAEFQPWHGKPYSININIPPLSVMVFKPTFWMG